MFDVIIDSGNEENIIERQTLESLRLPVEKHPAPYTIKWIKVVEKVPMKKRCKVPFSQGKYCDEVYYDIVDMDAYHILLGRPWQYDADA